MFYKNILVSKTKSNLIKEQQLGMSPGKANNILKKRLMFELVKRLELNICYRCLENIETSDQFSVDHKIDWLYSDNPLEKFMDLDNIAFSHLKCNSICCRKPHKLSGVDDPRLKHGTLNGYEKFRCRCEECTKRKALRNKNRK